MLVHELGAKSTPQISPRWMIYFCLSDSVISLLISLVDCKISKVRYMNIWNLAIHANFSESGRDAGQWELHTGYFYVLGKVPDTPKEKLLGCDSSLLIPIYAWSHFSVLNKHKINYYVLFAYCVLLAWISCSPFIHAACTFCCLTSVTLGAQHSSTKTSSRLKLEQNKYIIYCQFLQINKSVTDQTCLCSRRMVHMHGKKDSNFLWLTEFCSEWELQ